MDWSKLKEKMALTTDIYNLEGKTEEKLSFPKEYFGVEVNQALMAQAVRIFLSNQRTAAAHAKTRGEVVGSTKKIFRQKGTGNARHGDIKASIFVGGGNAHGPTGLQNYELILPKKMRALALKSALSQMLAEKKIIGVTDLEKSKGKTGPIGKLIEKLAKETKSKKFLLVLPKDSQEIKDSASNIGILTIAEFRNLSPYQVLTAGIILITKEALEGINK